MSESTPAQKRTIPISGTRTFREYFSVTKDSEAELLKDNVLRAAVTLGAAVTAGPAVAVGAGAYFGYKAVSERLSFNARQKAARQDRDAETETVVIDPTV